MTRRPDRSHRPDHGRGHGGRPDLHHPGQRRVLVLRQRSGGCGSTGRAGPPAPRTRSTGSRTPAEDTPAVVADGPAVTNSDGASCPFGLGMEKTVAPAVACAGTTVTYRYEITSEAIVWPDHSSPPAGSAEAASAINVDFEDQLPDDGRTFVAGSLVNPFGGDELALRRHATGSVIEDFDVPHGGNGTIEVDVALPAATPAGTLMNQARLDGPRRRLRDRGPLRVPRHPPVPRSDAPRGPPVRRHRRRQDASTPRWRDPATSSPTPCGPPTTAPATPPAWTRWPTPCPPG